MNYQRPECTGMFWKEHRSQNLPYRHRIVPHRLSYSAPLQSSVFKLSKDLIDSIHEEGIVAYTS